MGLVITKGTEGSPFGILIRALVNQDTGQLIEGPCNCVRAILAAAGAETIYGLVERMPSLGVGDKNSPLVILRRGGNKIAGGLANLLAGPRIGRAAHGDPAKEESASRPYRFVRKGAGVKKKSRSLAAVAPE